MDKRFRAFLAGLGLVGFGIGAEKASETNREEAPSSLQQPADSQPNDVPQSNVRAHEGLRKMKDAIEIAKIKGEWGIPPAGDEPQLTAEEKDRASWIQFVGEGIEYAHAEHPELADYFAKNLPDYDFAILNAGDDTNRLEFYRKVGPDGTPQYLGIFEKEEDGTYTIGMFANGLDDEVNVSLSDIANMVNQKQKLAELVERQEKGEVTEEAIQSFMKQHNIPKFHLPSSEDENEKT